MFHAARCAVGEDLLQALHDVAARAFLKRRHRAAIGQRGPGQRTNHAIHDEAGPLLELLDRIFGLRSELTINNKVEIRRTPQRALQPADRIAGRAGRNGRLSWISHVHPLGVTTERNTANLLAITRLRSDTVHMLRESRLPRPEHVGAVATRYRLHGFQRASPPAAAHELSTKSMSCSGVVRPSNMDRH